MVSGITASRNPLFAAITASRNPLFAAFRLSSDMFFQAAHYRNRYRTGTAKQQYRTPRNPPASSVLAGRLPRNAGNETENTPLSRRNSGHRTGYRFLCRICANRIHTALPRCLHSTVTAPTVYLTYRPYRLSDRKSSVTAITVRIPAVTVSAIHSPLAGSPAAAESTATATEPTGKSGTSTTTKSGTSTGRT